MLAKKSTRNVVPYVFFWFYRGLTYNLHEDIIFVFISVSFFQAIKQFVECETTKKIERKKKCCLKGTLNVDNVLKYGYVQNWDKMEAVWKHVFNNELRNIILFCEIIVKKKYEREDKSSQ